MQESRPEQRHYRTTLLKPPLWSFFKNLLYPKLGDGLDDKRCEMEAGDPELGLLVNGACFSVNATCQSYPANAMDDRLADGFYVLRT